MKTFNMKLSALVVFLICLFNFGPAQKLGDVFSSSMAWAKMTRYKLPVVDQAAAAILKKYKIDPSQVSLLMLDENEQQVISINPTQKKIPASITKLLTSFAVLKRFPPGQRFYTQILTDGNNLYLKGGGDPSFVSENMWYLVNEFKRSGLNKIKGQLIVDDSLFDRIRFDSSREDKRVDRAYDSPVGAMSFNWNAVNVFVSPGDKGKKAKVFVDPESEYFDLVNNTMTVAGNAKKELVVNISNSDRLITVSGEVSQGSAEKAIFKSISEPDLWAGINLKAFLERRDVDVAGDVKSGRVPENAELVASYESKNLSGILTDMNKFSNNFVAEMLTKNMAAQEMKSGATLKRGVEMIREEMQKIGIDKNAFYIVNPSGLTRDNSVSASVFVKVLFTIKKDFSIYPVLANSLPIAGVDGTLKKRMKNSPAEGWVRAKTGYLDGVVSLAGYAGRRDGRVLTFAFLYNGPRDEALVREAFDKILINSLN